MIRQPDHRIATHTPSHSDSYFALDYIRVQGPARSRLRQRFSNEMRNFLAAFPHPLDAVVRIGIASDIGTRLRHEDSAVALISHVSNDAIAVPIVLAAVADGVSGETDGNLASAIAIQSLTETIVDRMSAYANRTNVVGLNFSGMEGLLQESVSRAHYQIKKETFGGSSTLTCALIVGRTAYIAHVGDCRAYLLNTEWKDMELITHDHRSPRQWQAVNARPDREYASHKDGYELYRVLGQSDECEIDITRRHLANGSSLLLCTNGLWENISPEAIHATVHRLAHPQDGCERLIRLAVANNAQDDMTAVLVEMPG